MYTESQKKETSSVAISGKQCGAHVGLACCGLFAATSQALHLIIIPSFSSLHHYLGVFSALHLPQLGAARPVSVCVCVARLLTLV